ncbi:VWA domain-containing protein [Arthrobacter sp. SF27]|nr:VWA domain-containing protein [Arthrobacter sp. SF27]NMR28357.1 VWA domain-containing protein [Arthrobacter sp. SF27]
MNAAALAVGFTTALHRAGLPSTPERAAWLARSLQLIPPASQDRLYWTCRAVLVTSKEQLPLFDTVFASVFGAIDGVDDAADRRGEPNAPPPVGAGQGRSVTRPDPPRPRVSDASPPQAPAPVPGQSGGVGSGGQERESVLLMASSEERLHGTSFAELGPEELTRMRTLVRRIVLATPEREGRRTRRSQRSTAQLDIRRTVRAAQRTGSAGTRLVFARRRKQLRRLVLLCDVSGSMEPYTSVFLSLLQGAVAGASAEAFIFSTRLTRLTRQLAVRDPDQALARAAAATPDWAGGTRLAESLRRFIDGYGRRGLARGAVIVILSDGWAQDEPEQVAAQMVRLKRLAYRIIWVNPRKAAAGYQPLAGGMAAALPYCDAFISGHSYSALAELVAAIRGSRPARAEELAHRPHQSLGRS